MTSDPTLGGVVDTALYLPILTKQRQPDGTLIVTGIASDPTLDSDEQIADPEWLKRAMPAWFKFGNIREQHSSVAAGVATDLKVDGDRHIVTAEIVDPGSIAKVEKKVLKGFSIGIRNPRISSDKSAPGGRIVDGDIVEVSLVDRPANPSCVLQLAKAVGATVEQVETLTKEPGMIKCGNCGNVTESSAKVCPKCQKAFGEQVEERPVVGAEEGAEVPIEGAEGEGKQPAVGEKPAEKPAEKPGEGGGETGPQVPAGGGSQSLQEHEKIEMVALGRLMEQQAIQLDLLKQILEVVSGKKPEEKPEDAEEAPEEAPEGDEQESESPFKAMTQQVQQLGERLAKVEGAATARTAPVRMTTKSAPPASEAATKAAHYRRMAETMTDPNLVQGYLALAHQAETGQ